MIESSQYYTAEDLQMIGKAQFYLNRQQLKQVVVWFQDAHHTYLAFISLIGICLLAISLLNLELSTIQGLALFSLLAIVSAFGTTAVPELSFEITSAISMASIPLYGPFGAIIVATFGSISNSYAIKKTNQSRPFLRQLAFNLGMQNITMAVVGGLYLYFYSVILLAPILLMPVIWFALAIIQDQINFWLLMIMLHLQVGDSFSVTEAWKDTRWAMVLNIFLIWLGGGLVAYASFRFGLTGVLAYFVPVGLSAYAFRLYVRKMQGHMDNLEQIISDRTDELKQLVFEKNAFLTMLTHDMKAPLTSIGLYAHILESRPEMLLQKPHMATTISRSQKSLLELVNNILDVEQLQAGGGIKIRKEYFDFSILVESAIEVLVAQATDKKIALNLESKVKEAIIYGDESQLKRVITNLISNAIKYSPRESQVFVRLDADEHEICLAVEDNGYGIPEEDLPYIFDRYQRVESHKDIAVGTGLGLSIVKAIIDSHKGAITVESKCQNGSKFSISLPRR